MARTEPRHGVPVRECPDRLPVRAVLRLAAAEVEIAEIMAAWREAKRGGTRALQVVEELEEDVAKLRAGHNDWLRTHSGPRLANVAGPGWRWNSVATLSPPSLRPWS